jgi:arabinofuranosyltransferase
MTFPWLVLGVLGTATLAGAFAMTTRRYFVAAVAGSAAILLMQNGYFHYTSDDAYITFRYSRNLADGIGPYWNRGEHVEGYTNFLWMALLAALHKLGADIVPTARWLGFALALGATAGAYRLVCDLCHDSAARAGGVLAAVLLSASGAWGVWSFAGLESSLVAALIIAAVLLHVREMPGTPLQLSGIVWAFAAMTRPEALVLAAVSAGFKVAATVTHRGDARLPRRVASFLSWSVPFGVMYGTYFAWRYATYGWLFPNTYYAKVGSGLDQWERGLRYASTFLQEYGGWSLLIAPIAFATPTFSAARGGYTLALLAAWMAVVVYVGGDSLVRLRLFAPVLPVYYAFIVAGAASLAARFDLFKAPTAFRSIGLGAAAMAAIAMTLYPSAAGFGAGFSFERERQAVADRAALGRWLRANVDADARIAVVPAGAIPYESRLQSIDMLGLNDEHIAHRQIALGAFPAGHEKYDSDYVLNRRPDIIVLNELTTTAPWHRAQYRDAVGASLIPAVADMTDNERLWREYETQAVRRADGRWFNLLVRRDSAAILGDTKRITE